MGNTLPRLNFNLVKADTEVGVSEQRMLIIGQKLDAGTATAGKLIKDIGNDNSWDDLFGAKSVIAGMIRQARKLCSFCQYQVRIDAIPLDDKESATSATGKITFSGEPKKTGDLYIIVGSEYNHKYKLGISDASTPATIATALKTAIDEDTKAPFKATVSEGVVTIAFENKGTIGNNSTLACIGNVSGISVTINGFTGGATDPEITDDVLALISNLRYNEIVSPVEYGIDKIKALLDGRFNTNNKILDGVLYLNKADTLANHKEKVKPLNSANINYQCDKLVDADDYKGASIPEFSYIKAIYNATLKALRVSDGSQLSAVLIGEEPNDLMGGIHNNSLPFFNTSCPYLNPIEADYHWLTDEITEINKVGGSVWDNNAEDNTLIMGEQLSTYKTDNAGNEDITWKFMNYRDTGSAIREYRFKNIKKDFAQSRMNDDIEKRVRNAFLKYYKTLSDNSHKLLRSDKASFKFYEQNLKISLDFANGRVTVYCLDPYVTQLRECIGYFKATFDISTGEVV